ncbi:uncharacterized protein LOC143378235 [Andrena cerasifolii]|uniref:uncharacterized protein LOC143378235 n=1 Tax=Andrena cerasifolii TaxID=2819439 RepID=UPI00403806D8
MIAIFGTVLLISVIIACVGPRYYCKKREENNDTGEPIEGETPLVHIKISHPHRSQLTNDTYSDVYDCRRNSIDSNDAKEIQQVVQEAEPVPAEEAQIVSVKPPRERRRISTRIWSPALRNQLENITNSSSEVSGRNMIVVQAQIEAKPRALGSSSHEASGMHQSISFPPDYSTSPGLVLNRKYLRDEKWRKKSSIVVKKLKNMKRTLICSRSDKSTDIKEYTADETQRLNLPVFPAADQCLPVDHSTMLRKSRVVDASTSTRISGNISGTKRQNDEIVRKHDNSNRSDGACSKRAEIDRPYSNPGGLGEMVSLIKHRSVNGKSVCDVRISGLTMNQSDLVDLLEATGGATPSASIVTTEEASIFSIKFQRPGNNSGEMRANDSSFLEGSLNKLLKILPERLEESALFRLFRSKEQSKPSNPAPPSIKISDHSTTLGRSRNETSYLAAPNARTRIVADNSAPDRVSSVSRRFINYRTS